MKRAIHIACAVVHLATFDAVASSTVELARTEVLSRPEFLWLQDFSVDATHAYVAYALIDASWTPPYNERPVLGIHPRSDGVEAARVRVADLWAAPPESLHVRTVAYGDGVVVSAGNNVALVDRAGNVAARRRVPGSPVLRLGRHRDFVLASNGEGLALFDENLDLKHAWSTPDTLAAVRATADAIIALDGPLDSQGSVSAGTVRWLTLVGDQLVERAAVGVPIDLDLLLPPTILIWPDRALLVGRSHGGWQACELAFSGEIACGPAAWGADLEASVVGRRWAGFSVVRSGAQGYAVTVPNGCALWTRRYGASHLIAPQQYVLPSGGSDLGVVGGLLVRELDGEVLMLTSTSVGGTSWWGQRAHRIALHTPGLSDSVPVPVPARPMVDGCWSDGVFGRTFAEDGTELSWTAAHVRSCVARGADPNAVFNCGEWTRPLSQAARQDNAPAMRALIEAGAEVDARDEDGDTALHLAARYAESDASLKALLDGGADATLRNNAGYRPWDYAKDSKSLVGSPVLRLLQGD